MKKRNELIIAVATITAIAVGVFAYLTKRQIERICKYEAPSEL